MTDNKPQLAIYDNNCAAHEPCAVCGGDTLAEVGPELFLAGTWRPVCWACGSKYAPELMAQLKAEQRDFVTAATSAAWRDLTANGYDPNRATEAEWDGAISRTAGQVAQAYGRKPNPDNGQQNPHVLKLVD